MGLKSHIRKLLDIGLNHYDLKIIETKRLYEWQQQPEAKANYRPSELPHDAIEYLHQKNPRLIELQNRYKKFNEKVTTPLAWIDSHVRPDDILYFRGDNAYVWQLRGPNMNIMAYALTNYYVNSIDNLGLLEKLKEDDFFGNFIFNINNRIVSRDLLDSIIEIYFLEKNLNLSQIPKVNILDIGAGYGRLANRMVNTFTNINKYLCTDAVAVSSFISEYYLRFRKIEDKASAIPLDEVENMIKDTNVEIAVNIHSFSECRLSSIDWWLALLEKYGVKYLMIVPNSYSISNEHLLNNQGKDFGELIMKHGYKLVAKEPKYRDPLVQKYAINPSYHYLFELKTN